MVCYDMLKFVWQYAIFGYLLNKICSDFTTYRIVSNMACCISSVLADNSDLSIDNSWYHAQPYLIIRDGQWEKEKWLAPSRLFSTFVGNWF